MTSAPKSVGKGWPVGASGWLVAIAFVVAAVGVGAVLARVL